MGAILNQDGTTYAYAPTSAVEVEVGDAKQQAFYPQVKLKKWANEVNFSARVSIPGVQPEDVSVQADQIVWAKGSYKAVFYDRPDASREGGFEFEIHLAKKPPTNSLTFTIQTKGLEFLYQGELTPDEIARGAVRPANVVGSYAVYHASKRDNQYQAGKVAHIYRPHAVDAAGNETWGDVVIDLAAGTMTVSVPQSWLNAAVYPVIVDPTFGYSSVGGSFFSGVGPDYASVTTGTPASSGNVDSISVYTQHFGSAAIKPVLWTKTGSGTGTIPTNGIAPAVGTGTSSAWCTSNYSSKPAVTSGQDYYVGWMHQDGSTYMYYDTGQPSGNGGYSSAAGSYASPANITSLDVTNYRVSVYATYTASATTLSGAGSSAGAGAVSGVGAKVLPTAGTAAGTGAASGVGASTAATAASSVGTGAASGVGAATATTAATSAGTGVLSAAGGKVLPAAGSSAGTGAASGVGSAIVAATATCAGAGSTAGVGAATAVTTASCAGAGLATGAGAARATGALTSAGSTGTLTGTGAATAATAATCAGTGAVTGTGAATAAGVLTTAGVATVNGSSQSGTIQSCALTATGTGAVSGVGASTAATALTATGVGAVTGTAGKVLGGAASAAGTGAVSGTLSATATCALTAAGTGTATGAAAAIRSCAAACAGTVSVSGILAAFVSGTLTAAGAATCTAQLSAFAQAVLNVSASSALVARSTAPAGLKVNFGQAVPIQPLAYTARPRKPMSYQLTLLQ